MWKLTRKLLSFTLVLALAILMFPQIIKADVTETDFKYIMDEGIATITGYLGSDANLVVPSTVEGVPVVGIAPSAFNGNTTLVTVELPNSIQMIGSSSFAYCSNLTDIILPDHCTIQSDSFRDCTSLTHVEMPNVITTIASGLFRNCTALAELDCPAAVSGIENEAFQNCSSLIAVVIPNPDAAISGNPFVGCNDSLAIFSGTGSSTAAFAAGNGILLIDGIYPNRTYAADRVIQYSEGTATLDGGPFANGGTASAVGAHTFGVTDAAAHVTTINFSIIDGYTVQFDTGSNWVIEDVAAPANTTIAEPDQPSRYLFGFDGWYTDPALTTRWNFDTDVVTSDMTLYAKWLNLEFDYTISEAGVTITGHNGTYTNVVIPSELEGLPVVAIAASAFEEPAVYSPGDIELASIILPESLISIGSYAFKNCKKLTSITIPKSVTNLNVNAFDGCILLSAINVDSANTVYASAGGIMLNKAQSTVSRCPEGLTSSNLILPSSVTSIAASAFARCKKISGLTLPASLTTVGNYAFDACSGLTAINLPNTATNLGVGCFRNCTALVSVDLPDTLALINTSLFSDCSKLSSITIPNTVKSIGAYAFKGCMKLASPVLPAQLTSIGKGAFTLCWGIGTLQIPNSVTIIGDYAFDNCQHMHHITLPANLTVLGKGVFSNCIDLESITIPSHVTTIGDGAFYSCSSLTSITIPASVTTIKTDIFDGCSMLTAINVASANTIYSSLAGVLFSKSGKTLICYPEGKTGNYRVPDTVERIWKYAFSGNLKITYVIIPASVTFIGDYSFYYCSSLRAAYFLGAKPTMGISVFTNTASTFKAYYHVTQTGFWLTFSGYPKQPFCRLTTNLLNGSASITKYVPITAGKIAAPASPVRTGYTFVGWYKDAACTIAFNFSTTIVTNDVKLYAKWKAIVPAAPTGLSVKSASYNSLKLTWTASTAVSGYSIYRATSPTGTYDYVASTTNTSYTNTGLTTGKYYYYKISAYRTVGITRTYGARSAYKYAKPIPATPQLTVSRVSSTRLKASWTAVAGANGYEVWRATSLNGSYSRIKTTSLTCYTDIGLTTGKYYYYKVRAYRWAEATKVYGACSTVKYAKP